MPLLNNVLTCAAMVTQIHIHLILIGIMSGILALIVFVLRKKILKKICLPLLLILIFIFIFFSIQITWDSGSGCDDNIYVFEKVDLLPKKDYILLFNIKKLNRLYKIYKDSYWTFYW